MQVIFVLLKFKPNEPLKKTGFVLQNMTENILNVSINQPKKNQTLVLYFHHH